MRAITGSTVLYPSDAVSAERRVEAAANTPGIVYIRTSRPKTRVVGIREVPRSGKPAEQMAAHGIDAAAITAAVREVKRG